MSSHAIDLWVSAGSLEAPFYRFYTDAAGTTELNELVLDPRKSYTFRRLNGASSHPFYVTAVDDPAGSAGSDNYSLSGDGSSAVGITGDQSFTLSFSDHTQAPPSLIAYCTAHPTMQSAWRITRILTAPSTPDLTAHSDTGASNSDNLTSDTTPSFSGTAEAGSTVELFADGVSLGSTTADANGDWTFTVADSNALAVGSFAITATASRESSSSPVTLQRTPIAVVSPGRTAQERRNWNAFAALKEDGSVITWGDFNFGGDSSSVSNDLQSGVAQIFSTWSSFAALKEDGSVIAWGDSSYGGDSSSVSDQLQSGVAQIF